MKSTASDPNLQITPQQIGYRTAVNTLIVTGVFSVVFLVLLAANYVRGSLIAPKREAELAALKVEIQSHADDKEMLSRIRSLDLQIRRQRLHRLDLSRKLSYLLLGSTAVFLAATLWAASLKKRPPMPQPAGDERQMQVRQTRQARWMVAGGMAVLVLIGGVLVLMPRTDFSQAERQAGPAPSDSSDEEIARNWHRFRGSGGAGISCYTNIPMKWDGKTGEGILWKTEMPLPGHNSPVIWGDRVFVTGATRENRQVFCFDGLSGRLLWAGDVPTAVPAGSKKPNIGEDTGWAAPTAATDGQRVYAIFAGGDIACFDFNGKRVWSKSLGLPDNAYGYASSLEAYQNLVIVQYDQAAPEDQKSRLYAFDGPSGRLTWEARRPVANSWTSPFVAKVGDKHQLVTAADPWVIAYEPGGGEEIWRAKCVKGDLAPSAIFAGGLVLAIEPDARLVAIRPDGQGDVTKTHVAWRTEDGAPNICSPVSDGQLLYVLFSDGTLRCHQLTDGKQVYEKSLDASFMASPSLVANKLYLLDDKGVMFIAQAGREYREIARCDLGEACSASPAFADGRMYLRGEKSLYCIGSKP